MDRYRDIFHGMLKKYKVKVSEVRSFCVDVLADDEDNARFLASKKLNLLRIQGTLPESTYERDVPMFSWSTDII